MSNVTVQVVESSGVHIVEILQAGPPGPRGPQGADAEQQIVVSDDPPEDTSLLWLDTRAISSP